MGLKYLFIEKEESADEIDIESLTAQLSESETNVEVADLDITDGSDFVTKTYDANNLSNLDKSIFKVEALMNTLPKEMPTDTKRQTVTGIMSTVGLDIDEVVSDGENRVTILTTSLKNETGDINSYINSLEDMNETLKNEIADNEKEINNMKNTLSSITADTNAEIEKIDNLIKFIKGE